jgi:hypothetical protein
VRRIITFWTVMALTATLGYAKHQTLAPELKGRRDNSIVDVIVQFTSTPGQLHRNKISQGGGS